jgi:hypothetical protein
MGIPRGRSNEEGAALGGYPTPGPASRSIVSAKCTDMIWSKSTKVPQNAGKPGTPTKTRGQIPKRDLQTGQDPLSLPARMPAQVLLALLQIRVPQSAPRVFFICIESERQLALEALAAWASVRPRASGSRLAMHRHTRKYRRAARLGCNGARWSTRSSTAVTTGFVRGHRAPVTTNNRRLHRDSHHRCTRMYKRPSLPPAPRSSPAPSKLQLRT